MSNFFERHFIARRASNPVTSSSLVANPGRAARTLLACSLLVCSLGMNQAQASDAPTFSLPGLVDTTINLSETRGKVVYVDFWASWCVPCRASFPWMNDLQARYGHNDFQIIAINLDEDRQEAINFLKAVDNQLTVAFDTAGSTAEAFGVKGMPSSYVIDRNGEIAFAHIGFRQKDKGLIEQKLNALLGVSP